MLFVRRSYDKLLLLLVVAAVFCLLSYRPKSRITPQMPQEFLDVSGIRNSRQRIAEEDHHAVAGEVLENTPMALVCRRIHRRTSHRQGPT